MVKNKIKIIFFILLSSCSSSYYLSNNVPKYIKNDFDLCFRNKTTGIDSLININGYFDEIKTNIINFTDTLKKPVIHMYHKKIFFYDDGICLYMNRFGLYKISENIIKIQYINHPSKIAPWSAWTKWYKIIDKTKIIEIDIKPIETQDELNHFYKYSYDNLKQNFDTVNFVQQEKIPNPDCWLKKEKWFWCNEKDWQQFMDSIKQK